MKIRLYFAVIILASLFCGFFLEHVISQKQSDVVTVSNEVVSDQFLIDEFDRFENDLNQYFISVDLILGSGETYLIHGALKKSTLLTQSVNEFIEKSDLFERKDLLKESEINISKINELIKGALDIEQEDREAHLNKLLFQYDIIASQLTNTTTILKQQIIQSAGDAFLI